MADPVTTTELENERREAGEVGVLVIAFSIGGYLLSKAPWFVVKVFGAFLLISAVLGAVKFVYHSASYLVLRSPPEHRRLVQLLIVTVCWLPFLLYFASSLRRPVWETLSDPSMYRLGIASVLCWSAYSFAVKSWDVLPIRAFLVALVGTLFLSVAALNGWHIGHGVDDEDFEEIEVVPSPDRAFLNYVFYTTGLFTGLAAGFTRRG